MPNLFLGTGGVIVSSGFNHSDPSGLGQALGGALLGTAAGYSGGMLVERWLNEVVNPWYRPLWRDLGHTIQQWREPSPIPVVTGAAGGALLQELANGSIGFVDGAQRK